MTRKCHTHSPQTNPRYHEDRDTEHRQPKDSNNTFKVKQPAVLAFHIIIIMR